MKLLHQLRSYMANRTVIRHRRHALKRSLRYSPALEVLEDRTLLSGFNFTDFSTTNGLNLQGSAAAVSARLRLTPAQGGLNGSAWYTADKPIVASKFQTTFQFQLTGGGPGGSSDGFTFAIQNSSPTYLSGAGGTLGYNNLLDSVVIEFDTFQNSNFNDTSPNSISVHTNGTGANGPDESLSIGHYDAPGLLLVDGGVHTVNVRYLPGTLSIYLDDLNTPVITTSIDLATKLNLDNGRAWVGFTAATGGGYQNHDILNWNFQGDTSPSTLSVTPATIPSGGTATVTLTARDDAGNPLTTGGSPFTFGWSAPGFLNPGSGAFSNLADNHNGTYTATFTGTTVGLPSTITITATLNGRDVMPTTITVLPATTATPATQFAITNLTPTSVTVGGTVTFTVTAEDSTGATVPSYAGTVHFTSSDTLAVLPRDYTYTSADQGTRVFTARLNTAGTQSLTATDTTAASISSKLTGIVVNPPAAGTWSSAGNMASTRSQLQATLLNDGKVLVTGGIDANNKVLSSAELYDPMAGSWALAAPMAAAREMHTATLLKNGKVLVAGGFDIGTHNTLASAELYDPASNNWSAAPRERACFRGAKADWCSQIA